jgi:DNA-binding XRE family transcriptional regulator
MATERPELRHAEIGSRARMIRRRRGLSLATAAGLAGISKPYLSQLENGHKRFDDGACWTASPRHWVVQ